jgi:hypothetical protein
VEPDVFQCPARGRGEQTHHAVNRANWHESRPWAWGADADQGVTLTGSKANDIVVTRGATE